MLNSSELRGYSPERRTALVLTGTGADGAYHAGVLRALHETGIKIDIVAGRGIGALGAVLHAIDGAAPLWETGGVWRRSARREYYRWRWPFRWMQGLVVALVAVLAMPLAVVLLLSLVYPVALSLGMAGLDSSSALAARVAALLAALFAPGALPTWIPRVATLVALASVTVLCAGAVLAWLNAPARRTPARHALWPLLGAPVDAGSAITAATGALWNILRGGAQLRAPDARDLSRRYADLLSENLGQPGFRELLLVVHDLEVGRDMVFGLLDDPFRKPLFAATTASSSRRAEAHDLAGVGRDHLVDVLAAALSLPGLCNPRLVTFSTDAYWRGETHRLADRLSAVGRVLEEVAAAGAEQVIVVSAAPEPPGPHDLRPVRTDGMGRAGELLAVGETVALGDALRHLQHRFQGVYVIRPAHNPVRPLDLDGAYDERSDRQHSIGDVMERAYEDAYRQFIEPMLGASGDQLDG